MENKGNNGIRDEFLVSTWKTRRAVKRIFPENSQGGTNQEVAGVVPLTLRLFLFPSLTGKRLEQLPVEALRLEEPARIPKKSCGCPWTAGSAQGQAGMAEGVPGKGREWDEL